MRAIGYFRESSTDGQTLAQQNKLFLDFCAQHNLEVAGTFVDGASANGKAPGFRQLIAFLREHEDGCTVVVPSIDSLGSVLRDVAVRYFQIEGLGARIASMNGAIDATTIVSAWSAQDDGTKLSDRVRAAMRRKAVKGEVLGRPPYGYKVGNRRRLELIPEEAVVIRYIFRLYLQEGMGIRLIARRLNEEGLRTRRGGNWSMVSIRDILRNRVYLGTYSRFGVRVPGSHPALVSTDDFRRVQDRLNARRTSYSPRVSSQFLLSGLAHCGYCGNKLIGVSRKQAWKRKNGERVENSYRYYQCESRTNQSVCAYHTRRADELEEEVRRSLEASLTENDAASDAPDDEAPETTEHERERDRLLSRLRTVDRRLEGYVDSAAKGRLSKEKMEKMSIAAAADRLVLEDALEAIERRLADQHNAAERRVARDGHVTLLLEGWERMRFSERQAALREAVTRVTVSDESIAVAPRR